MTLRTKSRGRQWLAWCGLAFVALVVAAVWSFLATGSVSVEYFSPAGNRLALPFFALFAYLGWEMRWDGVRREKKVKTEGQEGSGEEKVGGESRWRAKEEKKSKCEVEVEERNLTSCAAEPLTSGASPLGGRLSGEATSSSLLKQNESGAKRHVRSSTSTLDFDSPPVFPQPPTTPSSLTGEALFDQARTLRHRKIPNFNKDAEYLDLLGKSAAAGYAPALAKLGEYAMRRRAWVEAYYWMKQAQRNGMHGLLPTLREIRKNWSLADFPNQSSNVNKLFTLEAGSIGRALLHVDSGHEASKACEFLKANYPEFVT